jgi:XTP/dITP diphosphohydrolase
VTTILIATTNPGKLREIRYLLDEVPCRWVILGDVPEPEETGPTFAENAVLKARYYAAASGLPTVAEDSGLVIDALGGRPGVTSARYPGATYPDKFRHLYQELAPYSRPWTARFVCSLAFVGQPHGETPGAREEHSPATPSASTIGVTATWPLGLAPWALLFTTEATVEGEIAEAPAGAYGFGYDPIFFYPPYGCTLGEVQGERKLAVAHRGKAFRAFREWLRRRG